MTLNWFKGLAKRAMVKNEIGLSNEALGLLAEDLGRLAKVRRDLPNRALCYAVDGDGEDVLADLRRLPDCGKALELYHCPWVVPSIPRCPREEFFRKVNVQLPDFLLRLAWVYEAAAQSSSPRLVFHLVPAWFEIFIAEAACRTGRMTSRRTQECAITAQAIEAMLEQAGSQRDLFVRWAFPDCPADYSRVMVSSAFCAVRNSQEAALQHPGVVLEALRHPDSVVRCHALDLLAESGVQPDRFAEAIVDLATSSSKNVREASEMLLARLPDSAVALVEKKLESGTTDERLRAVRLLAKIAGAKARPVLERRLEAEASAKVKTTIQDALDYVVLAEDAAKPSIADLPPVPKVGPIARLEPDAWEAFQQIYSEYNKRLAVALKRMPVDTSRHHPSIITEKQMRQAFEMIEGAFKVSFEDYRAKTPYVDHEQHGLLDAPLKRFLERPDVRLVHAVRMSLMYCCYPFSTQRILSHYANAHDCSVGMREVAEVYAAMGEDRGKLGWDLLEAYSPSQWSHEQMRPYFTERLHILEEALGVRPLTHEIPSYHKDQVRLRALGIVDSFPEPPSSLVPPLWEIALGGVKAERPLAMKPLERLPDCRARVREALKNGKQEVRAIAAEWLVRLGDHDAIPSLHAALKREKHDAPRVAMMNALESLGVPLSELLDRGGLAREAEAGLKKGIPAAFSWFPLHLAPVVHWSDTGEPVPEVVIHWWIIQRFGLGDPEPGPLLKRIASLLDEAERQALGQFVLEHWIAQDTLPKYTHDQAEQMARQSLPNYRRVYPGCSDDQIIKRLMDTLSRECEGSATKEKGILAVTGAFGGSRVAPVAELYLKKWYGYRASQSKALIRMLGWLENPAAVQLLLSVSRRFRTKGIQEEADRCVAALAERKGWSRDELADRTIPTAGFDEGPEMVLDYGERSFTARFDDKFCLVLKDGDGNVIKALPDARRDEDPQAVKEAKGRLSTARKELKSVLRAQKDRLYEAMCTQRTWRHEDWRAYLYEHPIVRHYCQQLVWVAERPDAPRWFRPLDDGTLADVADRAVQLSLDTPIRLAHRCNTPEEECKTWLQHLKDYEVEPLIDQFTRPMYLLPEGGESDYEIRDFEGHMIEAFKLRNRARALGYDRSRDVEGGGFYEYVETLPGLRLEVTIGFSGSMLPEENVPVALQSLSFRKLPEPGEDRDMVRLARLGDLPPVLISECWNDMQLIAAEGTGSDQGWRSKVGY